MGMGALKGVYKKRERAMEGHVSILSCALLSPLHSDTPRLHAIIIELSAIIRCHFCPSKVFLSGTLVSFSTHSCQSLTWEPKDLSNNSRSILRTVPPDCLSML